MEIWLWIVSSWIVTMLILRRKRIGFEHYVWMLLPVDMYGINIMGATLKPYMIFCVVLFFRRLLKRKTTVYVGGRLTKIGFALCILALLINFINGGNRASITSCLMLIFVYFCGLVYISESNQQFKEIGEVIKATAIGYGIVFMTAFALIQNGIVVPGAVAYDNQRMQPGIVMGFGNMLNGTYLSVNRLRGFMIDPNSLSGSFLPAMAICAVSLFSGTKDLKDKVCLVISTACIMASNSRTGIVCGIIIIIFAFFLSLSQQSASARPKSVLKFISLCIFGVVLLFFTNLWSALTNKILGTYDNRAGLTDEYGRLTVWKDAFTILLNSSPIIGIGSGMMQYRTATNLMCHNTWLEWLCGCGFIVGGAIIFYFVVNLKSMFSKIKMLKFTREDSIIYIAIVLGLLSITIELATVDNLTFSYLWFLLITGQYMSRSNEGISMRSYYARGYCHERIE